jgi:hypothetical protein
MKAIGTRKACPGWMGSLSFLSPGSAWTTAGTTHGHDPTCDRPFRLWQADMSPDDVA